MHVLHDEHRRRDHVQQRPDPLGGAVPQGPGLEVLRGRCRQPVGEVGQQAGQYAGRRPDGRPLGQPRADRPHRVDHGAVRQRLPQGMAVTDQHAHAAGPQAGAGLQDQPGLPDTRLALHEDDRGP